MIVLMNAAVHISGGVPLRGILRCYAQLEISSIQSFPPPLAIGSCFVIDLFLRLGGLQGRADGDFWMRSSQQLGSMVAQRRWFRGLLANGFLGLTAVWKTT